MATRSYIAYENKDGTYDGVYCHWDGYPEGVGQTLQVHYKHLSKIKSLINRGSISSLKESVQETEFHAPVMDLSIDRDRKREQMFCSAKRMGCEYAYIFENKAWTCVKLSTMKRVPLKFVYTPDFAI